MIVWVVWIVAVAATIGLGWLGFHLMWELDSLFIPIAVLVAAIVPFGLAIWWQSARDDAQCKAAGGHWEDDDHMTPIVMTSGKTTSVMWVRGEHCVTPR